MDCSFAGSRNYAQHEAGGAQEVEAKADWGVAVSRELVLVLGVHGTG